MGRKLTGTMDPTPVVNWREKKDSFFQGRLLSEGREVQGKKGKNIVYEFAVEDGDVGVTLKNETGQYVDVNVNAGDKVSFFAPTVLDRALKTARIGESIKITYKGLEFNHKNGREFHNFDVEVVDAPVVR